MWSHLPISKAKKQILFSLNFQVHSSKRESSVFLISCDVQRDNSKNRLKEHSKPFALISPKNTASFLKLQQRCLSPLAGNKKPNHVCSLDLLQLCTRVSQWEFCLCFCNDKTLAVDINSWNGISTEMTLPSKAGFQHALSQRNCRANSLCPAE